MGAGGAGGAGPRVLERLPHGPQGFRWLEVALLKYRDAAGVLRQWESAERKTRAAESAADAVAVLALVRSRGRAPRTLLVSQFRPPVNAVVLELPAGLIDAAETPEEAAVRELLEETGWRGRVAGASPVVVSDPGMSSANMILVVVEVDADSPENREVVPCPDEGEHIQTHLVGLDDLQGEIEGLLEQQGGDGDGTPWTVDARLWSLAAGFRIGRSERAAGAPSSSDGGEGSPPRAALSLRGALAAGALSAAVTIVALRWVLGGPRVGGRN